ncbi:Protein ASI3 [Nakaseomyces glabratus]|uniref:Protein ASI3 n=1 Tax=Candida glabrata TaxID=5478 RepID=A0A0W0DPI8_CANGB|nr:Protein ASI3 [Nakaseomyces glabratus]KTB13722.1 Protein ASI3 [Nakaseomyces glabratus]KTB14336.1 Protein ASI3 [Nakaseomyces glabratus]
MIREENGYEFGSTFAYGQFLNFFWPATLFILTYIPYQVAKLVRWDPFENNSKIKTQRNASKLQYYMFFEGLKSTLNFTGSESVEELLVTYLNRLCNIFFFDKQSVQNEMEELQLPNKISHSYVISGYLNPIKGAPEDVIKGDVTDNDGKAPVSGVEKAFSILPFYSPLLFANVKTIKSVISWIFMKVRSFYKTTEDIESTEEKRKNDLNKVDFNSYITEKNYYKDSLNQCLTRNKYSELNPDGVLTEAFIERVSHNANKIHTHEDLEGELDLSCVICKVNTRKIVLWPCRCLAICDECRVSLGTRGFKKCACCNTNIEAYSKLNIV